MYLNLCICLSVAQQHTWVERGGVAWCRLLCSWWTAFQAVENFYGPAHWLELPPAQILSQLLLNRQLVFNQQQPLEIHLTPASIQSNSQVSSRHNLRVHLLNTSLSEEQSTQGWARWLFIFVMEMMLMKITECPRHLKTLSIERIVSQSSIKFQRQLGATI